MHFPLYYILLILWSDQHSFCSQIFHSGLSTLLLSYDHHLYCVCSGTDTEWHKGVVATYNIVNVKYGIFSIDNETIETTRFRVYWLIIKTYSSLTSLLISSLIFLKVKGHIILPLVIMWFFNVKIILSSHHVMYCTCVLPVSWIKILWVVQPLYWLWSPCIIIDMVLW